MTDKEKLLKLLNNPNCPDSVEDIIANYLYINRKDFPAYRMHELVDMINHDFVYPMMDKLDNTRRVAKERALYLKTYLEGDMYTTKEAAIQHIPVQIKNAEAILEACNINKKDDFGMF